MTVTVKINTDTPTGKRLEKELRRYPETVQFIEPAILSEPYPTDDNGKDIESITAKDSAKQAFDRLGEKYDRKFDNKYTR
jgi:hypothetical protein